MKLISIIFIYLVIMGISFNSAAQNEKVSNFKSKEVQSLFLNEQGWPEDVEFRVKVFEKSLYASIRTSPVDNRAYLLSLALDIYNTLPPDLILKPDEIGIHAQLESDEHDSSNFPIKLKYHEAILYQFGLTDEVNIENIIGTWKMVTQRFQDYPGFLQSYTENEFIKYYLQQEYNKTIVLDKPKDKSSLQPQDIDLQNPTHYQNIQTFLEENKVSINNSIPPWETDTQKIKDFYSQNLTPETRNEVSDIKNNTSQKKINKLTEAETATNQTKNRNFINLYVLLIILIIGVSYFLIRKKNKK